MLAQTPAPDARARIPFYQGASASQIARTHHDIWPYAAGRARISEFVANLTGAVIAQQGVSPSLEHAARATRDVMATADPDPGGHEKDFGGEQNVWDGLAFLPRAHAPDYFSAVHQLDSCPDLQNLYFPACACEAHGIESAWLGNMTDQILSSIERHAPLNSSGVRELVGRSGAYGNSVFLSQNALCEECLLHHWITRVKRMPIMPVEQLEMVDIQYYKDNGDLRKTDGGIVL